MTKSVSCMECERLTEKVVQLGMKIETMDEIRENEQFIDSLAAAVQSAENGQTFIHGITSNLEHPITGFADTLPWICPNATGAAAEAPKPVFPNDASYWHSMGARPKA